MNTRLVLTLFLFLCVVATASSVGVKPARAITKIYIMPNGTVYPSEAPIHRNGDIYTLTANIDSDGEGIEIDRNNMTLDGVGYTLQGPGDDFGIYLPDCSNVTIRNVVVKSFLEGIYLSNSSNISVQNNVVSEVREEAVFLYSSSNVSIVGNQIANAAGGVFIDSSSNDNVTGNSILNCTYGLNIRQSQDCNFSGNSITLSSQYGMWLYNSASNSIFQNNITGNAVAIELNYSPHCTIFENQIANNAYAITFVYSLQNKIFHNNFVQNAQYFTGLQGPNTWDDGYPSGGNYWGSYTGPDLMKGPGQNQTGSDGIGDTAVNLDAQNVDHYPLLTPHVIPEFQPAHALFVFVLATLLMVAVFKRKQGQP
jgi:parallel beta-helix repeat protein